jgi:tellurium resistance protein TerD
MPIISSKGAFVMPATILEKDARVNIQDKSDQETLTRIYIGVSWDLSPQGKGTDLDLCVISMNRKTCKELTYFGNKKTPGVQLSDDNRTGKGEGDDEFAKIDLSSLPPDVDSLIVGLVVYGGQDFAKVDNPRIRVCDGYDETAQEIISFPVKATAFDDDTVLLFVTLKKTEAGWIMKADGDFYAKGKGKKAIEALVAIAEGR